MHEAEAAAQAQESLYHQISVKLSCFGLSLLSAVFGITTVCIFHFDDSAVRIASGTLQAKVIHKLGQHSHARSDPFQRSSRHCQWDPGRLIVGVVNELFFRYGASSIP